jgi:exopolysaccharide biosynthesis protein
MQSRFSVLVFSLCLFFLSLCGRAYSSIDFLDYAINGVSIKAISVDLTDRKVKVTPVISPGLPFSEEYFYSFICRARPVAAINGTYFNMATSTPVGEISIGETKYHSSGIGTVLAITRDNRAFFFSSRNHRTIDRRNLAMTLGGGPRLLANGKISTNYRSEGFKDPHIFQPAIRSAVGTTPAGRLNMVVSLTAVTLPQWSQTLRDLGCSDAINLDGGGSSALFYRGVVLVNPTRKLSNILAVYYESNE